MNLGLKNKIVLVTGGTKGIGLEVCRQLLNEGCKVYTVARTLRSIKNAKFLLKKKSLFTAFQCNLLNEKDFKDLLMGFKNKKINFDIIIHNVGGGIGIRDNHSSVDEWKKVWDFNVGIAIKLNNEFLPRMKKKKWGRVIHVSSNSAENDGNLWQPHGGSAPYSAAKAYLNNYVRNIGREYAKHNVVISGLMPGVVLTKNKYWDLLRKKNKKKYLSHIKNFYPSGRFATPTEIASFIVMMASKQSSFINSSLIRIDGGSL